MLKLVLHKNNFEFNGEQYNQWAGTAMGTRLAPSFGNLFMEKFEIRHVYNWPNQPLAWHRYMDDIWVLCDKSEHELETFITHLNSCHNSIKFSHEISKESVVFLDTQSLHQQ